MIFHATTNQKAMSQKNWVEAEKQGAGELRSAEDPETGDVELYTSIDGILQASFMPCQQTFWTSPPWRKMVRILTWYTTTSLIK